jgi:molybdopterin-guanine dinucleotide biosynthesis protein A
MTMPSGEHDDGDITLIVLAGGAGSRMGKPKSQLELGGAPILKRLYERLSWRGPTLLVTAPGREHPPGWERFDQEVLDSVSDEGPLRGIASAVNRVATPFAVVVPVDMPLLERTQLRWMAGELKGSADAALLFCVRGALANDHPEPLPLALRPAPAAPLIEANLRAGRRAVNALAREPQALVVPAPKDWPNDFWTNLNNPHDMVAWTQRGR